jgi:transcriptional regulator with XRE-family HTH domain
MDLGIWIRRKGISKVEVAHAIGVHPGSLSRYLSGDRFPDASTLCRIEKLTRGQVGASDFCRVNKRFRAARDEAHG